MLRLTPILLSLAILQGCAFYNEKSPPDPNTVANGSVNWSRVSAEVFQPRCSICHSLGGANFDSSTYASVVANINQVQERALVRKSMPADSPLTPYEEKVLSVWIQDGTPL
ncbi:MAG: hypothetical protein P4M08_06350 [Oligoflexia bacterium]|nr:hypothetical protein [Oligoflexia bacterium]